MITLAMMIIMLIITSACHGGAPGDARGRGVVAHHRPGQWWASARVVPVRLWPEQVAKEAGSTHLTPARVVPVRL